MRLYLNHLLYDSLKVIYIFIFVPLQVSFPKKVYIERILIYETFHAGGVVSVYAKPPNGKFIKIWQTNEVSNIESSRIFSPDFPVSHILVYTFKTKIMMI